MVKLDVLLHYAINSETGFVLCLYFIFGGSQKSSCV